jgi:hypothetical protein
LPQTDVSKSKPLAQSHTEPLRHEERRSNIAFFVIFAALCDKRVSF